MMEQILIRGIGVAPAKVNTENSLQIFAAIQPEGWLFRRKTGTGTAYFAISAVKVDAAASDALSSLFEDAIPAAAPKKAAKKAAK